MEDVWDDGPSSVPSAPSTFTSNIGGRGRGFQPEPSEPNGWGGSSYDSSGGGRGRGGGGGYRGGDRGGRGGDRGGRGGRGGGRSGDDGDRRRDGDWTCPDSSCSNSNFGWRQNCQKCDTAKPADANGSGGGDNSGRWRGGRGGGRGGRFDDSDNDRGGGRYGFKSNDDENDDSGGSFRGGRGGGGRGGRGGGRSDENGEGRKEDWTCPDSDCGNSNFGWRRQCQKCNTDKPGLENEKPRPEIYNPPDPTDDEESLYGGGISSGLNFKDLTNIEVKVSGENPIRKVESFDEMGLRPFVLGNIKKSGYSQPTPIQKAAVPIVIGGRDLMACAQTGSGKTAAFLVPIINTLLEHPTDIQFEGDCCEPQAVIVSPTRELTIQIFNEARKFAMGSILKICIAYGGTGTMHQAAKMSNGCHILVATPGRLNDFVNRGRVAFSSVRFFVLDEADRMLDMGFMGDMEKMLHHPTMVKTGERQTLMFSATFAEEIQQLAAQFLHNYLFVTVGIIGGACADVEQNIYQVARNEKRSKLQELLSDGSEKVLVFVETKRNADFIAVYLSEQQIPTTSIHGDREQREREIALNDFKSNRMRVLVATAVAARGLDIKGVQHVINYDMPSNIDEYVHRIGRTGRVGNKGKATSFFDSEKDGPIAAGLVKILQQAKQPVPDWLDSGSFSSGGGGFSRGSRFGGSDFRKTDSFDSGPQPQSAEPEEEW